MGSSKNLPMLIRKLSSIFLINLGGRFFVLPVATTCLGRLGIELYFDNEGSEMLYTALIIDLRGSILLGATVLEN